MKTVLLVIGITLLVMATITALAFVAAWLIRATLGSPTRLPNEDYRDHIC